MGKWLLALLVTHAADPRSDLVLLGPSGPTVAASFEHLPDGSVHGALLPGTHTALVVADRAPSSDLSWAGELLRVEPGKPAVTLCDRVAHASTPLVTPDGRVLVERGRAGPELAERLRVDELSVEEVTARGTRVVWRGQGYVAHLAGVAGRELILYMVGPGGALLDAVDLDSGAVRSIVAALPPFARDFHVDGNTVVLANRDDERRDRWVIERIDLASGRRARLVESAEQALAPFPWRGDVAYNDGGLRFVGGGRIEHRPGADVVMAVSGEVAAVMHYAGGWPELEIVEGAEVRQMVAPADSHVRVVGFVR